MDEKLLAQNTILLAVVRTLGRKQIREIRETLKGLSPDSPAAAKLVQKFDAALYEAANDNLTVITNALKNSAE